MKDNKVIFWSTIEGLEEIVPPQPAIKYIPEWWKNTPSFIPNKEGEKRNKGNETVKVCPALYDWFSQGYVIPMWCDLHIEVKETGEIDCIQSTHIQEKLGGGFMRVWKINQDRNITWIAEIRDGKRRDIPKEDQLTFKKIK